jgi:hypothetical protein
MNPSSAFVRRYRLHIGETIAKATPPSQAPFEPVNGEQRGFAPVTLAAGRSRDIASFDFTRVSIRQLCALGGSYGLSN